MVAKIKVTIAMIKSQLNARPIELVESLPVIIGTVNEAIEPKK